jgi:D-glycero-alpha-D-manno-heptose 1-phosphate guanylyltransferase
MQAVILAGGRGSRLVPLTDDIPKPMILIEDKPFLEYMILMLKRNFLKKILLCVGYLGHRIEDYFKDGHRWGVQIRYSYEKELLGTGGALKLASDLIEEKFLLLYGDSYLDIDYNDFVIFFEKQNTSGSVVIYDNEMDDTKVKNNIAIEGNIITKYDKDSHDACLRYVEAGVSLFKKSLLDLIEEKRFVSLENDIFPVLIKKKELTGYISRKRFYDIGTFDRLKLFQSFNF